MYRLSVRALPLMALITMLLMAGSVLAQVTTGALVGVVADQTGAVLPGASVTARNKATGAVKTVTTNENGEYEISPLQPADYEITVEASGFAKTVQESAVINVGSRGSLNFSLKAAGSEDIVTVVGEAGAVIETTNTVVQGVVDNRQVANLPLSGRTFSNLAVLVPGAKPVGAFDPTKARTGTVSLAGSSGRDANVSVDGGDNKDNVVGGALQNYTTEGIQEFVVQTQNFLPDTGRSAGGAITVVTKSGSNDVHGSFVIFERNDKTNRRAFNNPEFDPFTNAGPMEKQQFDRQNIAGSLGGPIIKDKFFIFGAGEYIRENISIVIDPSAVRELQALNTFAARGQIPGVTSVAALSTVPTPFRDYEFQIRSDYRVSDKQQMIFRYGHQSNNLSNDQITNLADVTAGAKTENELRSALFTDTYTINNSTVNVFTFQFNKFINRILPQSNAPALLFPSVSFGRNGNTPQTTLQNKFQFRDSISYVKGQHSLKFGLDYVFTPILGGTFDFISTPEYDFNTNPTQILASGMQLNSVDSDGNPIFIDDTLLADGNSRVDQSIDQFSFYGQDSFRINRKLTFNYGVRYDVDLGFYNPVEGSQATNRGVIALQKIGRLPQGSGALPKDDKNNFSPRVGFAYDPTGNGKAVIRASYGLYYDQIFTNVQFFGLQQANNNIYALASFGPQRIGIDPLPVATGNLRNLRTGDSARLIDPNIKTPYTQQSSINFQYEFTPGYVFDLSYIHILGLNQFINDDLNPRIGILDPNFVVGTPASRNPRVLTQAFLAAGLPALGRVRQASSINRSRYDGFTIGFTKRYGGGGSFKYQYNVNYTLARALVYGSAQGAQVNDFGFNFENPFDQFRPIDLGRANEDARHRVVLNGLVDMPFGLQVSSIIQAESARPFTVSADQDLNGDGILTTDFPRFDSSGNFIKFNPGQRATGQVLGINPGRGIPYFQVDLRVTKKINITERIQVQAYAEFFNLLDRANVGNAFSTSVFSSVVTGSGDVREAVNVKDLQPTGLLGSSFGAGTTIGTPFQAQFGVRISF